MNSIKRHEPAIQQDGEIPRKITPTIRTFETEETAKQMAVDRRNFCPRSNQAISTKTSITLYF